MNEVTLIRVRRKQDIIDKYKPTIENKVIFVVESSTPELSELKMSDDIRDLKLFKSKDDYDVIAGSKTSIKHKLRVKGYVKTREDRRVKNYRLFTRLICMSCESTISETSKRISKQSFRTLSKDHEVSESNVTIINNTSKCRFC